MVIDKETKQNDDTCAKLNKSMDVDEEKQITQSCFLIFKSKVPLRHPFILTEKTFPNKERNVKL